MTEKYAIGIDIGGSKTIAGIVNREGHLMLNNKDNPIKTGSEKYTESRLFLDDLAEVLKEYKRYVKNELNGIVAGIGVGAPNSSYYTGRIEKAPNMHKKWKEEYIDIVKILEDKLKLPAYLDNDANTAAIGEWKYGKGKNLRDFIVITLGSGLGSGLVSEGKLIRGKFGLAGELGHIIVRKSEGRKCGCGRFGCLEAYASAKGIVRTAMEFMEVCKDTGSPLYDLYKYRKNKGFERLKEENYTEETFITAKDITEAALQGDRMAYELFEYTGRILGEALADFAAFSDPESIFLFGGLANAGDLLLEPVKKHFDRNLLKAAKEKTVKIELSALNNASDAAVLGASALVWETK